MGRIRILGSVEGKARTMEIMGSTSLAIIYKIRQTVKINQISRRWRKLAAVPAAMSGIKRALSMIFSYHYDQRKELQISSTSESVPGDVREGHLAVYAGKEEEQLERFVIPVADLNHPVFLKLLRNAEEEFAFNYPNDRLTIPCDSTVLASIIDVVRHKGNDYHHVETGHGLA